METLAIISENKQQHQFFGAFATITGQLYKGIDILWENSTDHIQMITTATDPQRISECCSAWPHLQEIECKEQLQVH